MISELYLEIRGNFNGKSLVIKDVSAYNENLPVECGQLSIKVPGFNRIKYYDVLKGFEKIVNLSNLEIQIVNDYSNLNNLPDGAYHIKYSINPNDKLYVEYIYYNIFNLQRKYFTKLHCFMENKCELSRKEQLLKIDELYKISNMIDMIKITAEDCGDIQNADLLYNECVDLINKFYCDY